MTINEELLRQLQDTFADPVTFDVSLSNGTLSLFMWANALELENEEREFIFGLVDQMRDWNARHTTPPEPTTNDLIARADAIIESHSPIDNSHYARSIVPCDVCGVEKMSGAGMASHKRLKHPNEHQPSSLITIEEEVKQILAEDPGPLPPLTPATRQDGSCIHKWILGAPIGNFVTGTCEHCSTVKDFPSDPNAHKNSFALKGSLPQ